jgi:antitoxin HigA-1
MSKSSTITDKLGPVHPGEVLMEDFIKGFGITQNKVAVAIGVPPRRINEIVHGKRSVTADTALRLGRYFGVSAQFWLNLQDQYDLDVHQDQIESQLARIVPISA